MRGVEAAGRAGGEGRWVATDPGTRREAGLTEGSGERAQPNGARARLGRGGQKGTLLRWPPWVMEPLSRRGQAALRAPSRDLPDASGARGTLFPGVKPERRLVSREVGSSNPKPAPRLPLRNCYPASWEPFHPPRRGDGAVRATWRGGAGSGRNRLCAGRAVSYGGSSIARFADALRSRVYIACNLGTPCTSASHKCIL